MRKTLGAMILCGTATLASAAQTQPETFVVHAGENGRTATITIPVGAICNFSANNAEALVNYVDPQVEAMRLSGGVLIKVRGRDQPIRIEADSVVLELTPDQVPDRSRGAPAHRLHSSEVIVGGDDSETFVGNVLFTLQTSAGTMQIKADRVEHRGGAERGA